MTRFMKVSVPAEGYAEISRIGNLYVVHLDGVQKDDMIECYEYITEDTPDVSQLQEDLVVWKNYIAEKELQFAKETKCKDLLKYDSSDAVNSFEIRRGGIKVTDYWLDRDLRTSLEGDVTACSKVKNTYNFDIRELGITLELDCQKFLAALGVLRQYAYTAYNVTSQHLATINQLTSVQDVQNYNFTTGYPEKLVFDLEDLI